MSVAFRSSLLFTGLSLWFVAFAARGVFAQVADTVHTIGEITVTATREGNVRAAHAPQRVTVLDEEAISSTSATSVADLLSARSTIFVRWQGQGLATASLRGGGPSQAQILIDGMRLSDPQLGQFDLSLLPTHLLESVEILHGPGSALYGTDGMSGIIHLRAGKGERDRASLLTEAGAFGGRLASAGIAFDRNGISGLVSTEYVRSEGDFPYVDETLFPPRTVRRDNADRERQSLFASLGGLLGRHQFRGAVMYANARQGIPGVSGSASQGERRWDEHARVWLEARTTLGAGLVVARTYAHNGQLRYRNETLALDETGRTSTAGAEASIQIPASSGVDLTLGASGSVGSADHPSLSASASDVHGAAFASATVSYGRLRVYPALRVDGYLQSGKIHSAVSPRLGTNVRLSRRTPIYLKLSASAGFRVPTFNQRFWQPGGNPDLKPERALSVDAGVFIDGRMIALELTGFASRYFDEIVWADRGGYWAPVNLAETISRGTEASVSFQPLNAITLGGLYTFTQAVDRSNPAGASFGRQRRYVPRHHAKAFLSAFAGPIRLDVDSRLIGRRYVTSDESEFLDPAFVAGAQVSLNHSVGSFRSRLSVVVENVLDARYAVLKGYPMPPRHVRIRLLLETR